MSKKFEDLSAPEQKRIIEHEQRLDNDADIEARERELSEKLRMAETENAGLTPLEALKRAVAEQLND